jgi:hypothetical protein
VSDVSASGGGAEGEFSRYCRERDLKFQQWAWVKRVLIRKGVIGGRRRAGKAKPDVGRVGMMRPRASRESKGKIRLLQKLLLRTSNVSRSSDDFHDVLSEGLAGGISRIA